MCCRRADTDSLLTRPPEPAGASPTFPWGAEPGRHVQRLDVGGSLAGSSLTHFAVVGLVAVAASDPCCCAPGRTAAQREAVHVLVNE